MRSRIIVGSLLLLGLFAVGTIATTGDGVAPPRQWAVTNFVPEVAIHSKSQDERIVREHYDRGNDFFGWFLGERMIYTSGFFTHPSETL